MNLSVALFNFDKSNLNQPFYSIVKNDKQRAGKKVIAFVRETCDNLKKKRLLTHHDIGHKQLNYEQDRLYDEGI